MPYFRLADPWALVLLLSIPFVLQAQQRRRLAACKFPSTWALRAAAGAGASFIGKLPLLLRCLAIILLALALARPQEGRKTREILTEGVDIILAIDTSGSMRAMDFTKDKQRVTRLEIVKDVVGEFIRHRENDRIGIVAFGTEAFTQCPLTLDHNILQSFLEQMSIGMAGDATAIGSAIGIAVKRLKDLKSKSQVVILLTDGESNAGAIAPLQAAEIAKTLHIKIYTIGVGVPGKAPFLVDTPLGRQFVYQDVDLDEETLQKIAAATDARFFRAADLKSLREVYDQIDRLEKSEARVLEHADFKELFPYFLAPALCLILMEILLTQTRLQRLP